MGFRFFYSCDTNCHPFSICTLVRVTINVMFVNGFTSEGNRCSLLVSMHPKPGPCPRMLSAERQRVNGSTDSWTAREGRRAKSLNSLTPPGRRG